ncbi:PAS domain S-box-containing protein/diguanylate cyclase (GGDEF)-like protein [Thiohalophilus thiocyanatoxydans]|uniref:PAS domain S-box-containing protein/diguanylate cyclase (GGDEF)-like protein n=1 Tax=Thiohalophilus thiocyanatoxydans TaxID=381308 RepID=A0A4R8ISV3_9GAMM|nr:PAS domain S-box-containing protein/diguanylate cyclase (GGDEF)-like protein [Thiohalophilus thiocyanatoxydans]
MGRCTRQFLIWLLLVLTWQAGASDEVAENGSADAGETVVAVFPERFPPIYNITVNNLPTGFGIEIMEEVASRAGVRVEYVPVSSWEEAFAQLKSGRADIIPNLGVTEKREAFVTFTRPINKIPVSLLVLEDRGLFEDLSDLRGSRYIVGVVRNNVGVSILNREPAIRRHEYPHLADALLDLATDKIDAIIYPTPIAKQLARSLRLKGHLQALGKPIREIPRAIAVNRQQPELAKKLDKALQEVLASEVYGTIHSHWYPEPVFWDHRRVAYLVLTLLILGGLAYGYFRFSILQRMNKKLETANAFVNSVLDISAEGILTLNRNGMVLTANKAAEEIFGRDKASLVEYGIASLMPEVEAHEFSKVLESFDSEEPTNKSHSIEDKFREYRIKSRDGRLRSVRIALDMTRVEGVRYFICTVQDISQLREAQQLADFYITHDPLTGLINQNGFSVIMESLLSQSKRHKRHLSCLHIDIDRMHAINNAYGHSGGDEVLVQFSMRLEETIRTSDLLAAYDNNMLVRAGGNRFVIILPETDQTGAHGAAKRIISAIEEEPFDVDQDKVNITCKVGVATYPDHGATPAELLARSEAALRSAKVSGRQTIHFYAKEDDEGERNREVWVDRIITGIREDRFFLLFQPILEIQSGKVTHYEALMRYQGPDDKVVLPGEFIPVAEKYGLIKKIDRRVMELAISHLAGHDGTGSDISISINLSGTNIGDPELFEWLEALFEEQQLDPGRLVFEITETASLHSISAARSFIDSIKALGCRIALDDFGTGLSSFSYLRNFPVDILKIDGSFIRNLPNSEEDRVMVRSMVDVAHSLGKRVVAEFVCSEEIFNIVKTFGVDYAQGYFISEPIELGAFVESNSLSSSLTRPGRNKKGAVRPPVSQSRKRNRH